LKYISRVLRFNFLTFHSISSDLETGFSKAVLKESIFKNKSRQKYVAVGCIRVF